MLRLGSIPASSAYRNHDRVRPAKTRLKSAMSVVLMIMFVCWLSIAQAVDPTMHGHMFMIMFVRWLSIAHAVDPAMRGHMLLLVSYNKCLVHEGLHLNATRSCDVM